MAHTRFVYFDGFGRGEVTRLILKHLGQEFEDYRHTFESWGKEKTSGVAEFGQLPMLQIDGHNLVQSRAIEKYLLRRAGLLSHDLFELYQDESLVGYLDDIGQIIAKFVFVDKDFEGLAKFNQEQLPEKLRILERRLNPSNTHSVGNSISHADFVLFQFIHDYFLRPLKAEQLRPILEASAPRLIQFADNFKNASHNISAYLATRAESQF
uniref:Glutathione S-transferase n=1 Tax=Blepharisma japonicum TaxID=5961 RepID=Q50JG0_BLEJA|nr:glutathione S-transferase [Blepharisma japonicum]BAD98164.1 glutathione S-transferase [Blepharisma japonicum]